METKQISYILAISEYGSITKAAEKLFITQSALNQQLLKLEGELGVQLFHRSRNRFVPTEAGEVYLDYARRILALKEESYRVIQDLADHRKGTLSVAFAPERGMEMFMDIYPGFYADYPGLTVKPMEMRVREQLKLLQNDQLDLGFISMQSIEVPGLTVTPLTWEEFLLVVPAGHPLAERAAPPGEELAVIDIKALEGLPLSLMWRRSTQREVIDPLFEKAGVRPNITLETASNRANLAMVEKGLSCSIMPRWYTEESARKGKVARFRLEGCPSWNHSVCCRRGRYLSRATRDFIQRAAAHLKAEERYTQ